MFLKTQIENYEKNVDSNVVINNKESELLDFKARVAQMKSKKEIENKLAMLEMKIDSKIEEIRSDLDEIFLTLENLKKGIT